MRVSMDGIPILLLCSSLLLTVPISTAIDTINTTQSMRDGETIISASGSFELGFFSPDTSSRSRCLGIWYKISVETIVWVANREIPITDSSGVLQITSQGVLVLLNHNMSTIWSSNSSRFARNPVVQLLDSGNLVVKDEDDTNSENFLWQSFDYPSDTILPGMKLGRNMITGLDWHISSWKTPTDPSRGDFTYGLDPQGYPEMILRKKSVEQYRSGPWNGLRFSGTPQFKQNPLFTYEFVFNEKEIYYSYQLLSSTISRVVLSQNGDIARYVWTSHGWMLYHTTQTDNCDRYALCGAHGSCDINNSPPCGCLKGFVPKKPKEWKEMEWSNGCVRRTPINCFGDGFQKYSGVKPPETRRSWFNRTMNLEECKHMCTTNCSCTAFANLDIREGGSGCLLWFHDLIDIRQFSENGQDIFIRMAASELDQGDAKSNVKRSMKAILSSVLSTGIVFIVVALVLYIWKKKQQKHGQMTNIPERSSNQKEDVELPSFDFGTIASATNNFSFVNKVGEGGFGTVYKGILKDGQEIAVKRLSRNSRQGLDEFKNEVLHIVELQHRNLVKLLGCCIEGDEKMLVYEFMPNKSLDHLIFDPTQSTLLDWPKRYHIIDGIARGLLYLHQDSRLRIIHRDLKASNVLLDSEMNPKISDFGLARSFGGNEIEVNTNKVAGTYGYISPEYAIDGIFSVKSDVFSFGVLVLEIVSGKKNRGFRHADHHLNLLGHAWRLFGEGRSLELVDESILESCNLSEAQRSIHVGLLCVQYSPKDRPSMSSVVLMLGVEGALPPPKQPGFFTDRDLVEENSSSTENKSYSTNNFTITQLGPR